MGNLPPLERYLRENKKSLDQLSIISQSLLNGSLRIQQANFHLSELRKRFKQPKQLPADQQNLLTLLSRQHIDAIQAALDENEHTLLAIDLGSLEQAESFPHASSAPEVLEQRVSRYQELCQQLILGGAAESGSADNIAAELGSVDALIRSGLKEIQVAAPTLHH